MHLEHFGHLMKIWLSLALWTFPTTSTAVTRVMVALSNNRPCLQDGHRTVLPREYAFSNCSINNIRIPPYYSCCIFCNSSRFDNKIISISDLAQHARFSDHLNRVSSSYPILLGSKESFQATSAQTELHFSFSCNFHS